MLTLVKSLEDSNFKVILQPRAGLDYFKPDLEETKVQLAAVTALMDDIDPHNETAHLSYMWLVIQKLLILQRQIL